MVTIKTIANYCNVSTATVSHVLNKTRYVSPEITEKVHLAVKKLDYIPLRTYKKNSSVKVLGVFINKSNSLDEFLNALIKNTQGKKVKIISLIVDRTITSKELLEHVKLYRLDCAIIHSSVIVNFPKKEILPIPIVVFNSELNLQKNLSILNYDYKNAIIKALRHLRNLGHTKIAIFCSEQDKYLTRELNSSIDIVTEAGYIFEKNIKDYIFLPIDINPENFLTTIDNHLSKGDNTACLSVSADSTVKLINYLTVKNLMNNGKISIVTIGDNMSLKTCFPDITRFVVDVQAFVDTIIDLLITMHNNSGNDGDKKNFPLLLERGSSTISIASDHFGETASSSNILEFSKEEKELLIKRECSLSVSMNDATTMFSQLVLSGIKTTAETLNIKILSVFDAEKNDLMQDKHLKDMAKSNIDAVISFSNDHTPVQDRLFSLSNVNNKLVVLGVDVPPSLPEYSYVTCIATNETEKGRAAAILLAKEMLKQDKNKMAFICNGDINFHSRQRDTSAINAILEEYPEIEILCRSDIVKENNAIPIVKNMLLYYPHIEGLYIFNANIAILIHKFLEEIKRQDILIVTTQINYEIAQMISTKKNVVGIISSQPYELGRCLALAVAGGLIKRKLPKYIAVEPIAITTETMANIWTKIAGTTPPMHL